MGVKSWLGDMIGNSGAQIVESVGSTVDRFVHTGEEKAEAELALRELELEFKKLAMDAEGAYLQDRQSARNMYMKDSSLQKMFAMTFLVGYIGITGTLFYVVLGWLGMTEIPDVPAWAVSLISTVFGAMSSKVNTIVDFLFGGSQGERDNNDIGRAFQQAEGEK